jgi:hypothetical protein
MVDLPFSERTGIVALPVQANSMTPELLNSLWNVLREMVPPDTDRYPSLSAPFIRQVCLDVLRYPVEAVQRTHARQWLFSLFRQLQWYRVYDIIEYVVRHAEELTGGRTSRTSAQAAFNAPLERENSAYRIIDGTVTRVVAEAEAAEVEAAIRRAQQHRIEGAHQHISQALVLFGKRPDPDYRNAIKEAISAVEGTVKLIEGVKGGGLDKALDSLAKRVEIHGALKAGLSSLYGFTSDASGIRHPLLEASTVGEEDARFMIVTCSAAVNWIIAKAEKAGLLRAKGTA